MGPAQRAISLTTNLARYSGVLRSAAGMVTPMLLNRSRTAGVSTASLTALASRRTISSGVPFGKESEGAARAGHAAGAGDVLDHHLLAEDFAQPRRENAPERIDRAAGGVGHDQGHRPRRPVLRARGAERRQQDRDRSGGIRPQHALLLRTRKCFARCLRMLVFARAIVLPNRDDFN